MALNILDTLHAMHPEKITLEDVAAFAKSQHFAYDKDAALYYLAVLLESGDLESVARQLKDAAVLTVGLASPETVTQVITLANTAREIGLPRATSALTMATMLLCICPRSDSVRWTYARAKMDEQNPNAHPMLAYTTTREQASLGGQESSWTFSASPTSWPSKLICHRIWYLVGHHYFFPRSTANEERLYRQYQALFEYIYEEKFAAKDPLKEDGKWT